MNLIDGKYYWVRWTRGHEIFIAQFYEDGFSGSFRIMGVEEIFNKEDIFVLKEVAPYES